MDMYMILRYLSISMHVCNCMFVKMSTHAHKLKVEQIQILILQEKSKLDLFPIVIIYNICLFVWVC